MKLIKFILWQLVMPFQYLRKELELQRMCREHDKTNCLSLAGDILVCRFSKPSVYYFVDKRVYLFTRTLIDGLTKDDFYKSKSWYIFNNYLSVYSLYKKYDELLKTDDAYALIELICEVEGYDSDTLNKIYRYGLLKNIDDEFENAGLKILDYSRLL